MLYLRDIKSELIEQIQILTNCAMQVPDIQKIVNGNATVAMKNKLSSHKAKIKTLKRGSQIKLSKNTIPYLLLNIQKCF